MMRDIDVVILDNEHEAVKALSIETTKKLTSDRPFFLALVFITL